MSGKVSVVIASGAGGDFLFRCLDSLRDQVARAGAEVLVADRVGDEVTGRLSRDHDWVTVIPVELDHRPSVPELRQAGARAASGDIVAVIEEHCVVPDHWLETIATSFEDGDAALGGPILDHDYPRIRDWVVYFSEYNNYLPPWPDGEERYVLNGANIAYRRDMLLSHDEVLDSGYWEVVLHPRLVRDGRFRSIPRMGAHHTGPFDFGYYLGQRYLLCRVWGGTQKDLVSPAKRLVYLVIAPLLPFVLLARTALRVLKSGHRIGRFVLAFPLLVPVMFTYVWGEWLGYLLGPGDALERVE